MSYEIEVKHSGLNKYRIVKGATSWEAEQKAAAQRAQWDEQWARKLAIEQARDARSRAMKERTDKKEYALSLTADAQRVLDELNSFLVAGLQHDYRINWLTYRSCAPFPKPKPNPQRPFAPPPPQIPPPPNRSHPLYQPQLGVLDHVVPSRKQQRLEEANARFARDVQAWNNTKLSLEKRHKDDLDAFQKRVTQWEFDLRAAVANWEAERKHYEAQQTALNREIEVRWQRYLQGSGAEILEYCNTVLQRAPFPTSLPGRDFAIDYNAETKILVVEYTFPTPADMPRIREIRYIQSRNEFSEVHLPPSSANALYDSVLYQITLRTIFELFQADVVNGLASVVFNGWVRSIDPSTGQTAHRTVLSVQADRDTFSELDLRHVDPKSCFRKLKGIGSSKLHELVPVRPVLRLNMEDDRFIESYEVAAKLSEGVNIAAMDWEDFEHLIREVFEKEFSQSGGSVKVTQASRDRGVDAIAFDPDVIRGGKVVIQAKRYTNTVPVSAVRDLYGTVLNEGATKGILVTTSDFGRDSIEFADGKPITLISGGELLFLLGRHGHKARIDLPEAKRLLSDAEKAN